MYPIFDENSIGLIFSAVNFPIKKLGLVSCLNRPTSLYYIRAPNFEKPEKNKPLVIGEDYLT